MSCTQTLAGLAKDCTPSMGGIKEVFLANREDVTVTVASNKISGITMATGKYFYRYGLAKSTSSMSSNYTIDRTTGACHVVTDLLMVFTKMETSKRVEIGALAQGELCAIVRDCNGVAWYLGFDYPLQASAADGLSGTAYADRNGYSITLQDTSKELPYEILEGQGGVDIESLLDD